MLRGQDRCALVVADRLRIGVRMRSNRCHGRPPLAAISPCVSGRLVSAVDEQVSGKARQLQVIGLALQYRVYLPTAPPNNVTTPRHYQHDERPLPDAASLRRWSLRVA